MDSQLSIEVGKEVELLGALIPAVPALHLAVVMGPCAECPAQQPFSQGAKRGSGSTGRSGW